MVRTVWFQSLAAAAALVLSPMVLAQAVGSVNGSADVARAFHRDAGAAFAQHDPQAQGRPAAVAFNTTTDVQALADLGVVAGNWAQRLPHDAAPTTSTVLFMVRAGNPKDIRDWNDLVRSDVHVVIANPKTCNNGRYAYLGAWGSVRESGGSDAQAAQFVSAIYRNAEVVAKGERDAVAAFAERGQGDVLVAFESDAALVRQAAGDGALLAVYPSVSVLAENPVALVERGADEAQIKRAKAYLDYLYSDEAQEIAARHALRPRSAAVLARHVEQFKAIELFTVAKYFGSMGLAQKVHFSDGGRFDQLYQPDAARLAVARQGRAAPL